MSESVSLSLHDTTPSPRLAGNLPEASSSPSPSNQPQCHCQSVPLSDGSSSVDSPEHDDQLLLEWNRLCQDQALVQNFSSQPTSASASNQPHCQSVSLSDGSSIDSPEHDDQLRANEWYRLCEDQAPIQNFNSQPTSTTSFPLHVSLANASSSSAGGFDTAHDFEQYRNQQYLNPYFNAPQPTSVPSHVSTRSTGSFRTEHRDGLEWPEPNNQPGHNNLEPTFSNNDANNIYNHYYRDYYY